MSEEPSVPMADAEADAILRDLGRIMADSARDVSRRTGIPPQRIVKTIARRAIADDVMRVYTQAISNGRTSWQAAGRARQYLAHSLLHVIGRARVFVRPRP